VVRGEETELWTPGDLKAELVDKIKDWIYDPAPYIFGYYATPTRLTLAVIE